MSMLWCAVQTWQILFFSNRLFDATAVPVLPLIVSRFALIDAPLAALLEHVLTAHPNTLVILLGDHGNRDHSEGSAAEQTSMVLPYLSMLVPTQLLRANPLADSALASNRFSLTTCYDLYTTIRHLVKAQRSSSGIGGGERSSGSGRNGGSGVSGGR